MQIALIRRIKQQVAHCAWHWQLIKVFSQQGAYFAKHALKTSSQDHKHSEQGSFTSIPLSSSQIAILSHNWLVTYKSLKPGSFSGNSINHLDTKFCGSVDFNLKIGLWLLFSHVKRFLIPLESHHQIFQLQRPGLKSTGPLWSFLATTHQWIPTNDLLTVLIFVVKETKKGDMSKLNKGLAKFPY